MKVTRRQLRQIIKEELTMVIPKTDKQSGEGSMARGQLSRTGQIAAMLLQMIHDDTDLPELKEFMDQVSDLWDEMKPEQEREERGSRLGIRRREP
jgi:hypothetical protein